MENSTRISLSLYRVPSHSTLQAANAAGRGSFIKVSFGRKPVDDFKLRGRTAPRPSRSGDASPSGRRPSRAPLRPLCPPARRSVAIGQRSDARSFSLRGLPQILPFSGTRLRVFGIPRLYSWEARRIFCDCP
jgi:hypothetical protein